jgi:2-oxoglutarate ferredoxin oxidoreductase subunit delta
MEHPDYCTGCFNCAIVCPDGVITVYRQKVEVQ